MEAFAWARYTRAHPTLLALVNGQKPTIVFLMDWIVVEIGRLNSTGWQPGRIFQRFKNDADPSMQNLGNPTKHA